MFGHQTTDNRVTGLVIGGIELLLLGHDHGFALGAHHDLVLGQLEFVHFHHPLAGAGSEQRRLVDQVGQIGTREAGGTTGDGGRYHVVTQRHLAHVHLEDLLAATDIRQTDHHLAVEATGAQQRRVEHVRTVGGGDDDDAIVGLEAVHFHQQLVQGLFALVVSAAQTGTPVATDGVDLVDEDDAGGVLLGLFEHVAHPAGTHTDEHLDEVGTGNGEERHLGLTGNRLGQQGLTGTRLTDHQHATGNMSAQALELARITQELDQLGDFLLGLVTPGNVGKGGLDLVFREHACLALAEAHRATTATTAALHLAHEEHEDGNDDQDRKAGDQQLGPDALTLRLLAFDNHIVIQQVTDQAAILNGWTHGLEGLPITPFAGDHEAVHGHPLYLAIIHQREEFRVVQSARFGSGTEVVHYRHQHRSDDQPQDEVFRHVVQIAILLPRLMTRAWLYSSVVSTCLPYTRFRTYGSFSSVTPCVILTDHRP